MPKELLEVKQFTSGTISVPSTTDIPDDASVLSQNIDPSSESGKLKGIPIISIVGILKKIAPESGPLLHQFLLQIIRRKKMG